jgi:hypothetical protein
MSLSAAVIRRMSEMGLSGVDIAELAEMIEDGFSKPVPELTKAALRTRKWREKKENERHGDVTVTHTGDVTDPSLSPPSPTPPSTTNLSSKPPYSPPKVADLAERIWALQPPKHRRSTRPDVRAAVAAALKRGADPESLFAALRAYYRQPDCTKADGEFAKAAHRIVANDRWRDFLPPPDVPAKPAGPEVIAHRLQHWRDTGAWDPKWGPKPQDQAA